MGQAAQRLTMTTAEFLAWDAKQIERHEFVNGEVFAMAEAEDRHVTTSLNIAMSLRRHLRGTPGRTFMSDMKLHVASADSYFYPDVMVTCDAADLASPLVKTAPVLVVEVLSPTTAAYDRGEKFARYRRLPSLQEYMLVDIDTRRTDLYRKGADSMWVLHPFDDGQTVHLASVVLDLSAEALFAEVDPPAAA
jgi:Uma2 family endonuclease